MKTQEGNSGAERERMGQNSIFAFFLGQSAGRTHSIPESMALPLDQVNYAPSPTFTKANKPSWCGAVVGPLGP